MYKLTPEEAQRIRDMADDTSRIIEYLEERFEDEDKESRMDRIINVATLIVSVLALIVSLKSELLGLIQQLLGLLS